MIKTWVIAAAVRNVLNKTDIVYATKRLDVSENTHDMWNKKPVVIDEQNYYYSDDVRPKKAQCCN